MNEEHTGLYVCLTRTCKKRNVETGKPWNGDWPLAKRQHKCTGCKKRMLLVKVKKVMTEEAKAKLAALIAKRKEKV